MTENIYLLIPQFFFTISDWDKVRNWLSAIRSVLFSHERFTWSIISERPYLSAVAGPLKLAERKMTCLNLEKCDLSFTPLAGICTDNLCTVKHQLLSHLFLSCCTEFSKKKWLFCRSAPKPWLAKTKLFFLQKHTYHSEKIPHNFGVPGQHTAELGKSVLGPLKCFIASDPWPATQQVGKTLMVLAVYNLGMRTK